MRAAGRRDRGHQRHSCGVGARPRRSPSSSESPLLETSRADRGTVIDSARIAELPLQSRSPMALVVARRRRQLQRPGDLPPSVRQRRARRLVDERRTEQQQRVPARRRAEQRQPGRQQHRLRAAGGSRPGNEDLHQLLRRAVRPHRRRRRQHVAQVGHQQLPRRRLRLHAAQGAGRQLVHPQLARADRRPISTSISTGSASTARSGRTRRSSCSPARSTGKARPPRCSARCRRRR